MREDATTPKNKRGMVQLLSSKMQQQKQKEEQQKLNHQLEHPVL